MKAASSAITRCEEAEGRWLRFRGHCLPCPPPGRQWDGREPPHLSHPRPGPNPAALFSPTLTKVFLFSLFDLKIFLYTNTILNFTSGSAVKNLPAMWETPVRSLGWEDPLGKEMATHSSTLAWKIPWTEEPVGYSPWGCKELDTTEQLHFLSEITGSNGC